MCQRGPQAHLRGCLGALLDHGRPVGAEHSRHRLGATEEELCQVKVEGEISASVISQRAGEQILKTFSYSASVTTSS